MKQYRGTLVLAALIAIASLGRPPVDIPSEKLIPHFDKVVHLGMYATLAWVLSAEWRTRRRLAWLCIVALTASYGGLMEWMQSLTATRHTDLMDAWANTAGSVVGAVAWLGWHGRRRQPTG